MRFDKLYSNSKILDALNDMEHPCIINAGPGAGKTRFLCYKVINLLLTGTFLPEEIIVCTFTEKAAAELKSRIRSTIQKEDPELLKTIDLENLRIGTIHSILEKLISDFIEYSGFKSDFKVLDAFSRILFINKHLQEFDFPSYCVEYDWGKERYYDFDENIDVFFAEVDDWLLTRFLNEMFDAIVDEGLEANAFQVQNKYKYGDIQPFIKAYHKYVDILHRENCIDFSQIQSEYWRMLQNQDFRNTIRKKIKYILIDEYQDTNRIQERLLLETIGNTSSLTDIDKGELYPTKSVTVVGDINQSLYRFRGADIDNILTFSQKFSEPIKQYHLFVNYRSNLNIINLCNEYIQPNLLFYQQKGLHLTPSEFVISKGSVKPDFPVVTSLSRDRTTIDAVQQMYDQIQYLKINNKIKKYSDVAILLPSIRFTEANAFQSVFGDKIQMPLPVEFFSNKLIKQILRELYCVFQTSIDFSQYAREYGEYMIDVLDNIKSVCSQNEIYDLKNKFIEQQDLLELLYSIAGIIQERLGETINLTLLGIMSDLLTRFSGLYQDGRNTAFYDLFFSTFLDYVFENADDVIVSSAPTDPDKIYLMTIHQSKGLEFPIVLVGYNKTVNNRVKDYVYTKPNKIIRDSIGNIPIEDEEHVEYLELRRLFYVAFSRAKDLLLIGSRTKSMIEGLRSSNFTYEIQDWLSSRPSLINFDYIEPAIDVVKPTFSFTKDIETYNLCPQMYALINEYGLQVSGAFDFSFGKLVHQTIENLNKYIIEHNEQWTLQLLFKIAEDELDKNLAHTITTEKLLDQRQDALFQVKNYIQFFFSAISDKKLFAVEQPISYETQDYLLTGRLDVMYSLGNSMLIIDVKSGKKANKTQEDINNFIGQIRLYGQIIKERLNQPVKLMIYSTGEPRYQDGQFDVSNENLEQVYEPINKVLLKIINKDYSIDGYDVSAVCPKCSFQKFCKLKK